MVQEKLDIHMQKTEIGPSSFTSHKNQLKWTKGLNVKDEILKPEIVKLLE